MKKQKWTSSLDSRTPSSVYKIKPMDKQMTIVILSVIFVYVWIMLIVYYYDNKQPSKYEQSSLDKRGLIFSLEKSYHLFDVDGFEYFDKNPLPRRPNLNANKVWFLRPSKHGLISLRNVQSHIHRPTHVSIFIKYHSSTGPTLTSQAKLIVSAMNYKTHEMVTTHLDQYGTGYCTKVVFLGVVNEITVEGSVDKKGAFVIIDELLIGLGLYVFDDLKEETCS